VQVWVAAASTEGGAVTTERPKTPTERWACIVHSEAAKKHAVRKYTNRGVIPPLSLAPYANYGA
jgi:hypothetical protein